MLNLLTFFAIAASPSHSPAIQVDPLLLVEAQEMWSIIGKANNPVWPGWDARKTPILIYFPGKQDLLVNHPKPPKDFQKYDGPIHSSIGPIYLRDGKTFKDWDGQNTSMEVNGVETLVIADTLSNRRQWVEGLAPAIIANPNTADKIVEDNLFPNPYSQMVMFVHEAFHVYQRKMAPDKFSSESALARYPSLSVENNVGVAIESDFLAAALKAKDDAEVKLNAVKWLATRQWRRAFMSKEVSDYEDGTEFSEGTATYVEYRTLQCLQSSKPSREMWLLQGFRGYEDLSDQRSRLIRQMQASMDGSMVINNDPYGASPVRFRLYFSGMGIGALLDRLGSRWHDRILKTRASLTDLARETIRATPQELESALTAVKATSRYADLVREKTELAKTGEAAIAEEVAKFSRSPGVLVLDYSKLESPAIGLTYTPFGILRIDDARTMYRLVPIRGQIGKASFSEDSSRPMIQDVKSKMIQLQMTSAPDGQAILKQIGVSHLDGIEFQAKELTLPGITLKNVKGRITLVGSKLTIQLLGE